MRVWKQWTDEHRTTRKTGSGRWKVTSARDDRHLLCMGVNDRSASSRQFGSMLFYCYMCTNIGFVNSLMSAATWIPCKGAFIQDPPHGKPSTGASAMGS
ncbi:uncharacterized protein TNCV_1636721 [Trichonephila clavipes]|nr:uncharacterized protein TNCV_1636721 [Trichonephila clavipes]